MPRKILAGLGNMVIMFQDLYKVYKELHDYFGGDAENPMKFLKDIQGNLGIR